MSFFRYISFLALVACGCLTLVASPRSSDDEPAESAPAQLRIVVGGDFMQHLPQVEAAYCADGSYDYSSSLQYAAPLFRGADIAILNLETTLSVEGPYSGYPMFCSPVEVADAFVDMGIDLVALANNHCCDRFYGGIVETTQALDRRQLRRIGAYRSEWDYAQNGVQYFSHEGINLAFVNFTYGTNGIPVPKGALVDMLDDDTMERVLSDVDFSRIDCLVAIVHWGNEYERRPNAEQLRIESFLRERGVDVIIGSHPHVVQRFDVNTTEGVTLYSLGNFVSNQQRRYCDGGLVATIDITKQGGEFSYSAKVEPVWVRKEGYVVIPQSVADTLSLSPNERVLYNRFITDTEALLSE